MIKKSAWLCTLLFLVPAVLFQAGSGLEQELSASPPFLGGQPDSVQIERLRSLGKNRVEVRLLDGTEISGRATVTDSGLVLTDSYWQNASQRYKKAYFARWDKIDSIRPLEKDPRWPAILVISAAIITTFFLCISTWTD
jgi:hypothetical protein